MHLCSSCQLPAAVGRVGESGGGDGGWFGARDLEEEEVSSSANLVAIPSRPIKVIDYLTRL